MAKYTRHRKQSKSRKSRRSLRKTQRRISRRMRGGYSPINPECGGCLGRTPTGKFEQQSGALPDPAPAI